ncbi:MAG TPA: IS21-like element helper ATPase IstB [Thermoguttaceae bacterium]|nr:IS21-like element helper ATPase IstB [Thermoguttaceae bacterium]
MTTPKKTPTKKKATAKKRATAPCANLRERVLDDSKTLRLPLSVEMLDAALSRAEQEGLSHLSFLQLILGEPAVRSRQRAVERRIREARFREEKTLAQFDWKFNASTIDRAQIEQLATGEFVRRGENLVMMGPSGVGKSHLLQSLSRSFCELGYRVRYTTSADLLEDLRKSLADESLPRRVRYWAKFDLLIIDEFGFDRIERGECPQAANLFYKVIDARSGRRSTALATNIDFEAWSEYLGDPPLAMAFLDRVVDGAILLKIRGKSYRAHRVKRPPGPSKHDTT